VIDLGDTDWRGDEAPPKITSESFLRGVASLWQQVPPFRPKRRRSCASPTRERSVRAREVSAA
jgi:hypothetical protein